MIPGDMQAVMNHPVNDQSQSPGEISQIVSCDGPVNMNSELRVSFNLE